MKPLKFCWTLRNLLASNLTLQVLLVKLWQVPIMLFTTERRSLTIQVLRVWLDGFGNVKSNSLVLRKWIPWFERITLWVKNTTFETKNRTMARYYVNKNAQPNGDHEVHKEHCNYMPEPHNRIYLGDYATCAPAVTKAKNDHYPQSNGCYYCSNSCHTS